MGSAEAEKVAAAAEKSASAAEKVAGEEKCREQGRFLLGAVRAGKVDNEPSEKRNPSTPLNATLALAHTQP